MTTAKKSKRGSGAGRVDARGSRLTMDDFTWLRSAPALAELMAAYPQEWKRVQCEIGGLLARDNAEEITAHIKSVASHDSARREGHLLPARERVASEVRRQMAAQVLKQAVLRASTGVSEGRVRFNLLNGYIAQRLLFRRDLERKPVSMRWFRLIWPLLRQRRLLMPLVQPKGIWCFYSAPLIARLAELIGDRACLEIAAGDGTLSRFLAGAGVRVTATDDYSWSDSITFPDSVQRQDARRALRDRQPEVVICSWPPAGNPFEQHVFATPSVQQYIVISSQSEHSTGNWAAYRQQTTFDLVFDQELSSLVLPPEVKHAVYIFTRRAGSRPA